MSSSAKRKEGQPPPSREDPSKIKTTNSMLEATQKMLPFTTEPPPYAPEASEKYPDDVKREVRIPTQPKGMPPSRARNKYLLLVLTACLVGCLFVVFTRSSLNFKLNQDNNGKSYASYCSGHGIELRDSSCVCDLGYTGSACQETYPIEPAHKEGSTGSTPSVLLVTDTFGPLNPYNELASAYENIAIHLGSNSFQVTVLYVGEESGRFAKVSKDFASKSIKLVQLPSAGLNYGPSPSTTISVDVFRWMLDQHKYDVVHFQANSGAGYYTLLAQHQGLTSWNSKFVVGLDSTSIHSLMEINSGDAKFLSTDLESLKQEYMQEKSIEYADTILVPSKAILDDIRALQWKFEESAVVVLPHIPSKSAKRYSDAEKIVAKELVFIGSLNIINGIPIFCDAIDHLIENDAVSKDRPLRVTFLGSPEYIYEMTSAEYLETRSINWPDVQWEIVSEPHTVEDVVTYMSKTGSGRVAVLPRMYDGSAFLFQELVGNNVPIISSRLAAMENLVEASSTINAMFEKSDFKSLADRLSNALSHGFMPLEPATAHMQKSWSSVFQEIAKAEIISWNGSDKKDPLVTVVLVHRNRQKFLEQAIESLYEQTYKNFEVILVDDGSDDVDAIKFLQDLAWNWWETRGWKVLREPHRYLGAARNTGIKHAKGSYVLFMDDDDYAKPHQIETLVRVAERTNADVITAGHDLFDGESRPPGRRGLIERRVPLGAAKYVGMLENCFGDSNMMVLRSFFVDFGGFSEDFGVGFEDYEFLAKVVLRGHHLEVIPESLHWYRRHRDAMSFNTDRKANQIRFLRAYMQVHQNAPHRQRALLEYTKTKFFARDSAALDAYEGENLNTTMTDTGPQPTNHPCGPSLIIDDFAAKNSISHGAMNRLGLETDWVEMKDGRVVDGKLMLTPNSTDQSFYYSILSKECFDASAFNALEIVVGAETPVNSSFAVVLRSPKECSNSDDVDLRSLRTTQYATFNGTQQVLRIQLSDFELDTCRLHGLVLEDFSPADGTATYVIDSIRFYTECMAYPTEVYQIPPTATGTAPEETGAYYGVAITSMTPPAANISSDLKFTLDGKGFQNYGVNLKCVVDGEKTEQAPVIVSETAVSCNLKDIDVLGGHTLTLSVNGTIMEYSRAFFLYPSDAEVTTCQAKGYVGSEFDVRVDGHKLIDTGHVSCVIEGPNYQRPIITPASPASSEFDPYSNPPPVPKGEPSEPAYEDEPNTEIVKTHSWTCPVNVTMGGLYNVRLSLDGGVSTIPGHVNTRVFDSAPVIVEAGFDASGATFVVSFTKEIRIVGDDPYDYSQQVNCSTIFETYTGGNIIMGDLDKTRCSINGNSIEVAVSPDSVVNPDAKLQFTEKTIFSKYNPFDTEGWLENNEFTVLAPAVAPVPVVVVSAPRVVGSCSAAYISVEESYNDAGRPLKFYWSTNSTNTALVDYLKTFEGNVQAWIEIPNEMLVGGEEYFIEVWAGSIMNVRSDATTVTFLKSAHPVPEIQILGTAVQTVLTTDDYFIRTETTQSKCYDDEEEDVELVYKWSFEGDTSAVLPSEKMTGSSLYIKSNSLLHGKVYTLRVEVSPVTHSDYIGFDTVEIRAQSPAPSFAIGNGDVTVGVTSDLQVYAYYYDPLHVLPVVAWTCHIMDDITETPCTIVGDDVLDLTASTNLQIDIAKNILLPNKQYKFTGVLTTPSDRGLITDSILVTTVETVVPVVAATVVLPTYNARQILPSDILNVFAEVQKDTYSTYKELAFVWSSMPGTTKVLGNTVKLSTIPMNTIKVTQNKDQLIIQKNTLLPGNTYRFQVVVTDTKKGTSGSAIVDVSVAKAPTVGSIVVTSTGEGVALSDTFEITASQWTVDPSSDMPLSYQFDVFTSADLNGLPAFTFPFQISPKVKTLLPSPSTGTDIWIVVTAKSKVGATSSKAIGTKVKIIERTVTQMKTVFEDAAKDAIKRGDTGTYLRIATGVVNDLLALLAKGSAKKLRVRDDNSDLSATLNTVLDGVLTNVVKPSPVTGSTLELHACTLQTLVSMPSIVNAGNAAAVLEILLERIKTLQTDQNASPYFRLSARSKQCISRSVASLSAIYAQYFSSSDSIRKTILEIATLTNALYMREMACGAPTQVFTTGSTTEYLRKADLSGFTLSANDDAVVTFPEEIPVTNGDNTVNCFCMQETVQDAGLYSFVDKELAGSGTVQIASTASNLRLRDCSSVQRSVPKNEAGVLSIANLPEPIELTLKLTPTSKTVFNQGKHDVQCVFYDTSKSPPILSTEGVTTKADGDNYTCGTSHLSTLMLVLSGRKVEDPTTTATQATATPTSTATSVDSSDTGGGISGGAIAGIVIGVCGGAAIAGGAAYFIMKKK